MPQHTVFKIYLVGRLINTKKGGIIISKRFHKIDLHKRYATISTRNKSGKKLNFKNLYLYPQKNNKIK